MVLEGASALPFGSTQVLIPTELNGDDALVTFQLPTDRTARFLTLRAGAEATAPASEYSGPGFVSVSYLSDAPLTTLMALVVGLATVAGALVTIWGAVRSAGNWFLTASPRTGRAYVHHSRDPMETVQEHFADLVRWLHYPVIVLIDDLDRCRGDYVVELLEGIQTLFRDQPVAYVVAASNGMDTGGYTFAYVAGWAGGDAAKVRATADTVLTAVRRILDTAPGAAYDEEAAREPVI